MKQKQVVYTLMIWTFILFLSFHLIIDIICVSYRLTLNQMKSINLDKLKNQLFSLLQSFITFILKERYSLK